MCLYLDRYYNKYKMNQFIINALILIRLRCTCTHISIVFIMIRVVADTAGQVSDAVLMDDQLNSAKVVLLLRSNYFVPGKLYLHSTIWHSSQKLKSQLIICIFRKNFMYVGGHLVHLLFCSRHDG